MITEDWERVYLMEDVFAQERASLLEQEYYEHFRLPAKVTGEITLKNKKDDKHKNDTISLPRISEESI